MTFQNNGFGNDGNFGAQSGMQQQTGGMDMFIDDAAAPSAGIGPLPKGIYPCKIVNAEYKENNNKNGMILAIECEVVAGDFAGRKIFDNYNLQHENEMAQNIGQANYAKLCQSILGPNQPKIRNPQLLLGAFFCADWGMRKPKKNQNQDMYGAQNHDEPPKEEWQVMDRLPASAYKPVNAPAQQPMQQQQFQQPMQQAAPQQQQYQQHPMQQQQQQHQQPAQQPQYQQAQQQAQQVQQPQYQQQQAMQQSQQQPAQQFQQPQQQAQPFPGNDAGMQQQAGNGHQGGFAGQTGAFGQGGNGQGDAQAQQVQPQSQPAGDMNGQQQQPGGHPFGNGGFQL